MYIHSYLYTCVGIGSFISPIVIMGLAGYRVMLKESHNGPGVNGHTCCNNVILHFTEVMFLLTSQIYEYS